MKNKRVISGFIALLLCITLFPANAFAEGDAVPVAGITVTAENDDTSLVTGETVQLSAAVEPGVATDGTVTWSSEDEDIATVDDDGLVTAVSAGKVTITATANDGSGVTGTIDITVIAVIPQKGAATKITVTAENDDTSLVAGETVQLSAAVETDDASTPVVTWSSENEDIATVDDDGLVTAVSAGRVTVTATANDDSGVAGEIMIHVKNWEGDGTFESPYLIYDKKQLDRVRTNLSAQYTLMADITFTSADFASDGDYYNAGAGFVPIGSKPLPFTGVFDGNGHKILGLYQKNTLSATVYAGLFGYITGGTVKDLGMEDCDITAESKSFSFSAYAGGIAGCVNGGTVTGCYNTGDVNAIGYETRAGSIVGQLTGGSTVTGCYNTGGVNSHGYAGGIAGYSYGLL